MQFLTPLDIHLFLHFLIKKFPKNKYASKQTTHFSMKP